ncbi:hypothetical protein L1987_79377 [Smallanthus sonchifolius]|uniref:Uncharacterized protein n=1 Tax=Smallanthus sonchifolius TaxID=185202 RepID=A0ACB8ZGB3_9ASTR|nr:hypothetical protein L1987_79377 [Smallanthus sonchifolius]
MASSPSSSQSWIYHVFLSFRGEDTRKTYVDHLYEALVQKGIHTYKDDEALPRGETIGPALFKAIDESRIAVIIFSENYANSSWCLDEVEYIMRGKNERGQIVLPIFYHVDPSDVRKQKGKYKEAFAKHELENNQKVDSWRKALMDAGNLAGWESKYIANGHESKGIKEIVNTIVSKLIPIISNVNEDLIGIETRVQDLKSKLEIGSCDVRMIGIWGVGGGGNELSSKFDGCCFVENIREESSKYGLRKMQEKILSRVLKQEHVEVESVKEGRDMLKDRLCHRKVLIVLDDVNHLNHLKDLAGSPDWFGCDNFKTLPSITAIKKLETLSISKCSQLSKGNKQVASYRQYVTSFFFTYIGLQFISRGLRKLILSNCQLGDEDIDWNAWDLPNLQELDLSTSGDQKLTDSMSQGNAIEHHFMSLALEHRVLQMSGPSQVSQSRFVLQLPHNWYNEFCGFLIHTVIDYQEPYVTITIEQEIDEGECSYRNELFPHPPPPPTYIGYVSFSSLRQATWLNSQCNTISFYTGGKLEVKLVPMKSRGDHPVQTENGASDCSEFWDEERQDRKTFTVQHDSKSSINVLCRPC